MPRDDRPLTLFDLGVLIVSAACAMATLRWLYPDFPWSKVSSVVSHQLDSFGVILGLVAIGREFDLLLMPAVPILCAALMALALRGPRPRRWRRLWSRPGHLACLLVAVVTPAAYLMPNFAIWLRGGSVGSPPYLTTEWPAALAGMAVSAGWATLYLSGRWRPERNWIDRAGHVIAVMTTGGAILIVLFNCFT